MPTFWKPLAGAFAGVLLLAGQCPADSWLPPLEATYASPDGNCRFTVTPRCCEAGTTAPEGSNGPLGSLECRKAGGKFREVWQRRLVNDIAPADAVVSNSGEYVVTFDDWGKVGTSPNTVVIYGRNGVLNKRLALRDFLTREEIDRMLATTSSVWWGKGHRLDARGGHLVLRIATSKSLLSRSGKFLEKRIDLQTGLLVKEAKP